MNIDYKWKIWGIMSFSFLIGFFHRYSTAVIASDITKELNLTAQNLGVLASMYYYAYGFMQAPVGILVDTYGPRRVTFNGMLLTGTGVLLFGLSHNIIIIYISRFLIGVGASTFLISIFKILTIWFNQDRFTMMTGWTSLIGNIGALLAASPLALLISVIGWRNSHLLFSLVSFMTAFLLWRVVKDYPDEFKLKHINFERNNVNSINGIKEGLKKIIVSPQFWVNFIILFSIMGITMSFSGLWLIPYLIHIYNLKTTIAANYALILTSGMILSSALIGWIEKIIINRKFMIQLSAFFFSIIWSFFYLKADLQQWQLVVFLFIIGFTGIFGMIIFTNIKSLYPEFAGSSLGLINLAPFLGTVVLNTLFAWRLDLSWTGKMIEGSRIYDFSAYQQGFFIYLLFSILALIMSFFTKFK